MWLLLLEAFMAMMVLVFIVWWTMFSGRSPEPRADRHAAGNDNNKNDDNDGKSDWRPPS